MSDMTPREAADRVEAVVREIGDAAETYGKQVTQWYFQLCRVPAALRAASPAPEGGDEALDELVRLRDRVLELDQGLAPRKLNAADVVAEIEARIKARCAPTPGEGESLGLRLHHALNDIPIHLDSEREVDAFRRARDVANELLGEVAP